MKRKRLIQISLALAVLSVAMYYALRPTEPVYQGKTLTVWIDQYCAFLTLGGTFFKPNPDRPKFMEAMSALQHIGTNALPALIERAARKDSAMKKKLIAFTDRHPGLGIHLQPAEDYHQQAVYVFTLLGRDAKLAVPALISLLRDEDTSIRATAAWCLFKIDPEAKETAPALVQTLRDAKESDERLIETVLHTIRDFSAKPDIVVPLLVDYICGARADWGHASTATSALAHCGKEAKAAVPALVAQLDNTNSVIREAASDALMVVDNDTWEREFMKRNK